MRTINNDNNCQQHQQSEKAVGGSGRKGSATTANNKCEQLTTTEAKNISSRKKRSAAADGKGSATTDNNDCQQEMKLQRTQFFFFFIFFWKRITRKGPGNFSSEANPNRCFSLEIALPPASFSSSHAPTVTFLNSSRKSVTDFAFLFLPGSIPQNASTCTRCVHLDRLGICARGTWTSPGRQLGDYSKAIDSEDSRRRCGIRTDALEGQKKIKT
jgi:hypothetical protein